MKDPQDLKGLLTLIAEGDDKKAFGIFFRRYHAKLIRLALMFVSSTQDAEDIVSEVMIRLLRKRDTLFRMDNFDGYLYTAIKNQAINFRVKHAKRQYDTPLDICKDSLTSSYIGPAEKVIEGELRSMITATVEQLPPKRRMVYKMIKDDGLKYQEVATLLDIAERTVKKHLELAIRDLRNTLDRYYDHEKSKGTPVLKLVKDLSAGLVFFLSCLA